MLAIALGLVWSLVRYVQRLRHGQNPPNQGLRHNLGRDILLGLVLLVAAEIIRTVGVAPTLDNVLVLGDVVATRSFLSMALEIELGGRWPWQRDPAVRRTPPRPPAGLPATNDRSSGCKRTIEPHDSPY